jgi:hypothetical protein
MAKTKKKSRKEFEYDIVKANRRGSREAELECENGFVSKHKIHKSEKTYSRRKAKRVDFEMA